MSKSYQERMTQLADDVQFEREDSKWKERIRIVEYLRAPNADGTSCSAEREMLAQRIERGEHLKVAK